MSLGFNTMRAPRYTNLPGAVGGSVIVSSFPSSGRQIRPSKYLNMTPMKKKPSIPTPDVTPATAPVVKIETPSPQEFEQYHGVYATARSNLVDPESGEEVVTDTTRVYMVYPMKVDSNEKVIMRTKKVNCTSGQLSYHWVIIYDPTKEERYLSDFSIVP